MKQDFNLHYKICTLDIVNNKLDGVVLTCNTIIEEATLTWKTFLIKNTPH